MQRKETPDKQIRILLIDDDEDDYLLTRDLIADIPGGHYTMAWESDFDAALAAICRDEFDVYLIDFRLGAKTGLDLLKAKQDHQCPGPVILLTGGDSQSAIDHAAEDAGADDFLEKGRFDSILLERSIRYALRQQAHREELEKKVAERTAELAAANARLVEADRRKDEFLATLAHELRNPLAPIRNSLEILRLSTNSSTGIEKPLKVVERQTKHMVRLIDDLLDASRINRNNLRIELEPTDLCESLRTAIETSEPHILSAGVTFHADLPGEPIQISGDSVRLCQLFSNLITNAAKYTDRGGTVTLSVEKSCEHVTVKVTDSGVGIAPELLPHVFDMFAQVNSTMNRSQGGLGIGLALAKRLAEMHGGVVMARSNGVGHGAEFIVTLPLLEPCACARCRT
jgi:signal transduction histidine kinase